MAKYKRNTQSFAEAVRNVSSDVTEIKAEQQENDSDVDAEELNAVEEDELSEDQSEIKSENKSETKSARLSSDDEINDSKQETVEKINEVKSESGTGNKAGKKSEGKTEDKNENKTGKSSGGKTVIKERMNMDTREIRIPQMEKELKSTEEIKGLNEDTTFITQGTLVHGDIESDGDIEVRGRVDGNIRCSGKLIISGTVNGDIVAGELYGEEADITGEIRAQGIVKIGAGSVTVGNISAETAVVAGAVKGDMDIRDEVVFDSTAVVIGNIKSKSVDIRSGAIVEGFCKQVYSNVDVEKYFSKDIESL